MRQSNALIGAEKKQLMSMMGKPHGFESTQGKHGKDKAPDACSEW